MSSSRRQPNRTRLKLGQIVVIAANPDSHDLNGPVVTTTIADRWGNRPIWGNRPMEEFVDLRTGASGMEEAALATLPRIV